MHTHQTRSASAEAHRATARTADSISGYCWNPQVGVVTGSDGGDSPPTVSSIPLAECRQSISQSVQDNIDTRIVQQVPYTGNFKIGNTVQVTNKIDKKGQSD